MNDKSPLLFLDVNLGRGKVSRLVIYEGDRPDSVANIFADQNSKSLIVYLGFAIYFIIII